MLPLRIAFDMDGTLADLHTAYARVEAQLFDDMAPQDESPAPEIRELEQHEDVSPSSAAAIARAQEANERRSVRRGSGQHRDRVWQAIEATPDFWTTLEPIDPSAIERTYQLTLEHGWEVFFITQRPVTAGGTVQWQTHKWLAEHGFLMPNVIPLSTSRGKAASALRLDYLVDDTPQNCVDVLSDSATRAILLVDPEDALGAKSARRLGIGTAHTIHEALDLLVQATEARANPSLFEKLRKLAGWK